MLSSNELSRLQNLFQPWEEEIRTGFNRDFIREVYEMRVQMKPREILEPLDMLEYKRNMLRYLDKYYVYKVPVHYTDQELLTNRTKNNVKVTKELTKIIKEQSEKFNTYGTLQELDYFHRLRYEDNKYCITADVGEILYAYQEIQTCLSPGGENQAHLIELLASPYFYLVTDLHRSVRMGILVDYENKKVFLNNVYGSYDSMVVMAVINHFIIMDFDFVKSMSYFHDDYPRLSYLDNYNCSHQEMIEAMGYGASIVDNIPFNERVNNIFALPRDIEVERDLFTGAKNTEYVSVGFALWGNEAGIVTEDERICGSCGEVVDASDFDDDYITCHYCAEHYCSACDNYYDIDDMWDDDTCHMCHMEMVEDARAEYVADLKREEKLEERLSYE